MGGESAIGNETAVPTSRAEIAAPDSGIADEPIGSGSIAISPGPSPTGRPGALVHSTRPKTTSDETGLQMGESRFGPLGSGRGKVAQSPPGDTSRDESRSR